MSLRTATEKLSPLVALRKWDIWGLPGKVLYFVLTVEVLASISAVQSVLTTHPTSSELIRLAILVGLAVTFEEVAAHIDTFRWRMRTGLHNDMTGVWTFAAAVVLPLGLVLPLVLVIRMHVWHRHLKMNGAAPFRQVYTTATIFLACLGAHEMSVVLGGTDGRWTSGVMSIVGVAAAIVVYSALNTGLVYSVMWLATAEGKRPPFLKVWQDKALEVATLSLSGLAALALIYEPWLTVLVIPSMVVLQRGVLTKELHIAATTDSKTGLLNAVTWHELAERELTRASREDRAAAMLIVDMDNFKLINDTYGHLVGDAVLKDVAHVMTDELRGYDTIGRFGGEEFVALLGGVSPIQALDISDRILTRIRELKVATRGEPGELVAGMSASIGIACFPQQGTEVEDLLHVADAALYTAKREGRDRVEYSYVGDRPAGS